MLTVRVSVGHIGLGEDLGYVSAPDSPRLGADLEVRRVLRDVRLARQLKSWCDSCGTSDGRHHAFGEPLRGSVRDKAQSSIASLFGQIATLFARIF